MLRHDFVRTSRRALLVLFILQRAQSYLIIRIVSWKLLKCVIRDIRAVTYHTNLRSHNDIKHVDFLWNDTTEKAGETIKHDCVRYRLKLLRLT